MQQGEGQMGQAHIHGQQYPYPQQQQNMADPSDQMDVVRPTQDIYDQQRMMVPGQPIIQQNVMGKCFHSICTYTHIRFYLILFIYFHLAQFRSRAK